MTRFGRLLSPALVGAFVLLLVPALALAATKAGTTHEADEGGRWALAIAYGALVVPSVLGWYVSRWRARKQGNEAFAGGFRRLLVGDDNRVSTSKTAAAAWTYLVAGSILAIVIADWMGHPGALDKLMHSGLEGQYAVLMGGPIGAAILAKAITASKVGQDPAAKAPNPDGPKVADVISNDAGHTDLGDLQYVLFNGIAIVYFVGTLLQVPHEALPHIPDVLLSLTSVSAAGYVGKKFLPSA